MPAEKLTKRRFFQILIMLGILIFVFLYRTYHHSDVPNREYQNGKSIEQTQSAVDFTPILSKQKKR